MIACRQGQCNTHELSAVGAYVRSIGKVSCWLRLRVVILICAEGRPNAPERKPLKLCRTTKLSVPPFPKLKERIQTVNTRSFDTCKASGRAKQTLTKIHLRMCCGYLVTCSLRSLNMIFSSKPTIKSKVLSPLRH